MKHTLLLASLFALAAHAQVNITGQGTDSNGNPVSITGTVNVQAPAPAPTPAPAPSPAPTPAPAPAPAAAKVAAAFLPDTASVIQNPERGFYGWPGDQYLNNANAGSLKGLYSNGLTMGLGVIDMSGYRNRELDQNFLDAIASKMQLYRANGLKAVILPVYNYDSSGADAPNQLALRHIQQLGKLFNDNADTIAYIKGGIAGAWGEQHDSQNKLDMATIFPAQTAAWPKQFNIGMRYPKDLDRLGWPANAGFFHDCQLSNDNEGGTFPQGLNDPMRAKAGQMTETRPFGGETCTLGDANEQKQKRMTCPQAIAYFKQFHIAFLNQEYDKTFISSWQKGGCLDQIKGYIGYRLQLDKVQADASAAPGGAVQVDVDMRNVGWARVFSDRRVLVQLRDRVSGANLPAVTAQSLKTLPSQASSSSRLTAVVPVPPNAPAGRYAVYLSVPDVYQSTASDPRFSITFANKWSSGQTWSAGEKAINTGLEVAVQ
jgi:hypothetical protein